MKAYKFNKEGDYFIVANETTEISEGKITYVNCYSKWANNTYGPARASCDFLEAEAAQVPLCEVPIELLSGAMRFYEVDLSLHVFYAHDGWKEFNPASSMQILERLEGCEDWALEIEGEVIESITSEYWGDQVCKSRFDKYF
jgi:hypothetical protein